MPPKLLPLSKQLMFLHQHTPTKEETEEETREHPREYTRNYTRNYTRDYTKEQKRFTKYLIVSRSFLSAFQQNKEFGIMIDKNINNEQYDSDESDEEEPTDPWEIYIKRQDVCENIARFDVKSIQKLSRFYSFLKPYCLTVNFDNTRQAEYMFDGLSALSKVYEGKLEFIIRRGMKALPMLLIHTFHKRLIRLNCDSFLLVNDTWNLPRLQLEYLMTHGTITKQLKPILLNHNIRKIWYSDNDPIFNFKSKPNFFDDFPQCPRVEQLKICYGIDEKDDSVEMLHGLVGHFRNLKMLECSINMMTCGMEFDAEKLVNMLFQICYKLDELQEIMGQSKTKVSITCSLIDAAMNSDEEVAKEMKRIDTSKKFDKIYDQRKGPSFPFGTVSQKVHLKMKKGNIDVIFRMSFNLLQQ